ncbi:hypothetical protein OOK29_42980 [Streptomyces phaeochromogenes]|uniref:hypothetical protein n=1 Tax=Streptomyces TaxID=1883 RepID=UPI00225A162A|nr:hypothetical protein [Streptomyces phaeochromogenes]MCX5604910.1 hypothetical protein [Streptomyces phaeochromogenes]
MAIASTGSVIGIGVVKLAQLTGIRWQVNLIAALLFAGMLTSLISFELHRRREKRANVRILGNYRGEYREYRLRRDGVWEPLTEAPLWSAMPSGLSINEKWEWRWEDSNADPNDARTRAEYREYLNADPAGYQQRLTAAQSEIENEETEEGIEQLSELLEGERVAPDPTHPESRHAMNYTASSVMEVFRLIGPPPPGITGPPDEGDGGVPDSGAGIPSGGRRG